MSNVPSHQSSTGANSSNFSLGGWPAFPSSSSQLGQANANPASNTATDSKKKQKQAQRNDLQSSSQRGQKAPLVDTPSPEQDAKARPKDAVSSLQSPAVRNNQTLPSKQQNQPKKPKSQSQPKQPNHSKLQDQPGQQLKVKAQKTPNTGKMTTPVTKGMQIPGPSTQASSSKSVKKVPQHKRAESITAQTPVPNATPAKVKSNPLPLLEAIDAASMFMPVSMPIDYSEQYMDELSSLIPSFPECTKEGYMLRNLSMKELEMKKRCANCNKFINKPNNKENLAKTRAQGASSNQAATLDSSSAVPGTPSPSAQDPDRPPRKDHLKCQFHPGVVQQKFWICCGEHMMKPGCTKCKEHEPLSYGPGQLEREWLLHETPHVSTKARPAVAIDCEMGTAVSGDSALIRISLVDYFTGTTLIDQLVLPDVPMQHFNTRFSGVTRQMMNEARRANKCLYGTSAARTRIWQFVDPETIVVGHSAHNDLKALRWIHYRIVDSFMLEPKPPQPENQKGKGKANGEQTEDGKNTSNNEEADHHGSGDAEVLENSQGQGGYGVRGENEGGLELEPVQTDQSDVAGKAVVEQDEPQKKAPRRKGDGPRSLKTLARVKLGRVIQDPARVGHDSLEDALASRDLVHWAVVERRRRAAADVRAQLSSQLSDTRLG